MSEQAPEAMCLRGLFDRLKGPPERRPLGEWGKAS